MFIDDQFRTNAHEHRDAIYTSATEHYITWLQNGTWEGSDFFTFEFPDGSLADVEIWTNSFDHYDDIVVTAYRQFTNANGAQETDWWTFAGIGTIDTNSEAS